MDGHIWRPLTDQNPYIPGPDQDFPLSLEQWRMIDMREIKTFTYTVLVSSLIGFQGVSAAEGTLVPAQCAEADLLINDEFCIQSTPNGESDYFIASATSSFSHPVSSFPDLKVVAVLCDGEQMLKAFRYTFDGASSFLFPLLARYWINDSISFMNHFPIGVIGDVAVDAEEAAWAQTMSFDDFEVEDSDVREILPMVRMKREFETYQSFKCYDPNAYGYYPAL